MGFPQSRHPTSLSGDRAASMGPGLQSSQVQPLASGAEAARIVGGILADRESAAVACGMRGAGLSHGDRFAAGPGADRARCGDSTSDSNAASCGAYRPGPFSMAGERKTSTSCLVAIRVKEPRHRSCYVGPSAL